MFLSHGVNEQGDLVSIHEVSAGRVPLSCPFCGQGLIAKKGSQKEHHFAHDGQTCADVNVVKLVSGVSDLYGKKNNAAQYGVFTSKKSSGTFPSKFDSFAKMSTRTEADFLSLSTDTMTELERMVTGNSPATGGYILFADYESDGTEFLLIAMLKDRAGMKITDDLKIEELDHIELNHLHQAARISLDKYIDYQSATAVQRQEMNYLSFVNPANNKTAAGYFITALGCSKGTALAEATRTVIKGL
ncbi:nucleoid-associated protein [Vibrio campbellii]